LTDRHHWNPHRRRDIWRLSTSFLVYAWTTTINLLGAVNHYRMKAALLGALEDRKMA
jgi:hypothetical protein